MRLGAGGRAAALAEALQGQLAAAAADHDWDLAERALLTTRALAAVPAFAQQLRVRTPSQISLTWRVLPDVWGLLRHQVALQMPVQVRVHN